MKVSIVQGWGAEYKILLKQKHQSFLLAYTSTSKDDVKWYAKMFRRALKAHDFEQASKRKSK